METQCLAGRTVNRWDEGKMVGQIDNITDSREG